MPDVPGCFIGAKESVSLRGRVAYFHGKDASRRPFDTLTNAFWSIIVGLVDVDLVDVDLDVDLVDVDFVDVDFDVDLDSCNIIITLAPKVHLTRL